jgi:hypothetical protein
MANIFWDRNGMLMMEFTITSEVYCETLKELRRAIQNKRPGMLTSGVVLLHIQLLALEHCSSISTRSCLTTLLTALISLQATTTCLHT